MGGGRAALLKLIRVAMMTAWVILLYGVLVAAGGALGYARAQSLPSLLAGGVAGLLLVGAGVLMLRGSYAAGWWAALVIALLLLARFAVASFDNFKWMPGGLMIVLSVVALAALLAGRTPPAS